MLPYVLDAMREVRRAELIEVGRLFGIDGDDERVLRETPRRMRELVAALGIPSDLARFGIAREDLPALLDDALGVVRLAKAFPVPDVSAAYARIVDNAWHGRLATDAA